MKKERRREWEDGKSGEEGEKEKCKLLLFESVEEILNGIWWREVNIVCWRVADGTVTAKQIECCGVRLLERRWRKERKKECEERDRANGIECQTSWPWKDVKLLTCGSPVASLSASFTHIAAMMEVVEAMAGVMLLRIPTVNFSSTPSMLYFAATSWAAFVHHATSSGLVPWGYRPSAWSVKCEGRENTLSMNNRTNASNHAP